MFQICLHLKKAHKIEVLIPTYALSEYIFFRPQKKHYADVQELSVASLSMVCSKDLAFYVVASSFLICGISETIYFLFIFFFFLICDLQNAKILLF